MLVLDSGVTETGNVHLSDKLRGDTGTLSFSKKNSFRGQGEGKLLVHVSANALGMSHISGASRLLKCHRR